MSKEDTFAKLLKRNHERWGRERAAMRQKEFGIWQKYSWTECYKNTKWRGLGLVRLGLEPGDKVCIIGDNEPEWIWFQWAVQAVGGVTVGIFADSMPAEIKYIVTHSDSRFVVARDQEQVDKVLEIKDEVTQVEKVIFWELSGMRNYQDPLLISENEVIALGREYEEEHPGVFEEHIARGKGDDLAGLFCTSGTTSYPKLAKFTYRALIGCAEALHHVGLVAEKDNAVVFWPQGLTTTDLMSSISSLIVGITLNFPEKPETAMEDLREISPDVALLGPRHWESLTRLIQARMSDANVVQRLCYNILMPLGYKIADLQSQRMKPNPFWKALHYIAWFLLLRPLRDRIGLVKTRFGVGGSALMGRETFRFLQALKLKLRTIYGSAETAVVTSHRADDIKIETAGVLLPETEVRISADSEVLIRGSYLLSGYYKNPEAEEEALSGGWFHSGDAGYIDDDGHLVIIDRMKELGELASGAKYSPQYIESQLRFSPYIKDAMIMGQGKDYLSVLINIDFDNVGIWAERNHISYTTFVDLSQKTEVASLVVKDLTKLNEKLPEYCRIEKYVLLHKEFDADEAELTRTRKLRREFMEHRYHDLLEGIYQDRNEVPIEAAVRYRDGRTGTIDTTLKIRCIKE